MNEDGPPELFLTHWDIISDPAVYSLVLATVIICLIISKPWRKDGPK